jgi:hypothetical protein
MATFKELSNKTRDLFTRRGKKMLELLKGIRDFFKQRWKEILELLKGTRDFFKQRAKEIWVRRELVIVVTLYLSLVAALIVYRFPGSWKDFPASWRVRLNYIAARQLEANHQLRDEDMLRPRSIPGAWGWFLPDRGSLNGKYVVHEISGNQDIDPSNLQEQPDLAIDDKFRLVSFPLDKQVQLCSLLNSGSHVDVMGAKEPVDAVRVHAVVRLSAPTEKPGAPCFVLLEVEKAKEPLLAPDQLATLHLVLSPK